MFELDSLRFLFVPDRHDELLYLIEFGVVLLLLEPYYLAQEFTQLLNFVPINLHLITVEFQISSQIILGHLLNNCLQVPFNIRPNRINFLPIFPQIIILNHRNLRVPSLLLLQIINMIISHLLNKRQQFLIEKLSVLYLLFIMVVNLR